MANVKFETEESYYKIANEKFIDEEFEDALTNYSEAIELSSEKNPDYYEKRAACYLKLEKFEEAIKDCNEALTVTQKGTVFLKMGQAYFELEKFSEAKDAFEKALENTTAPKFKKKIRNWVRKAKAELAELPKSKIPGKKEEEKKGTDTPKKEDVKNDEKVEEKKEKTEEEKKKEEEEKKKYAREEVELTEDWPEKEKIKMKPKKKTRKELIRYQFFQVENTVSLNILKLQKIPHDKRKVECNLRTVKVCIDTPEGEQYKNTIHLYQRVKSFKVKHMSSKTEIIFEKESGGKWDKFERDEEVKDASRAYPTSSQIDWDRIDADLKKEKVESDNPNSFFQTLFKDATPEQQKAMMKSYRESGGTVLSTNWEDVGKKTIKMSPPEGMEPRRWDGYQVDEDELDKGDDSDHDDDHHHDPNVQKFKFNKNKQ